jgi:hypothetical protein
MWNINIIPLVSGIPREIQTLAGLILELDLSASSYKLDITGGLTEKTVLKQLKHTVGEPNLTHLSPSEIDLSH